MEPPAALLESPATTELTWHREWRQEDSLSRLGLGGWRWRLWLLLVLLWLFRVGVVRGDTAILDVLVSPVLKWLGAAHSIG